MVSDCASELASPKGRRSTITFRFVARDAEDVNYEDYH